ncbi:MAG TPA: cell division protein FtsA [Candidatus Paceibacterota bacterium]|nr:cell division protein FtsA [Candidatus Paceibacterota bacterium]
MLVTAIDIGSSQIKGLVADVKKDGTLVAVKTLKKRSDGVKRGEIVDVEETVKGLFEALSEIKHFDKSSLKNIVFGISGTKSRFLVSRAAVSIPRPDLEIIREDIDRVIKESLAVNLPPGWQIIHSFPREFIVDDIEVGDDNILELSGRKLEANVILIALFSTVYKNFLKVANLVLGKKSGFDGSLIFSPLAADRAILSKKQKELGVALIDLGFGTTSLVVYQDGKMLSTKIFPVGAGNITNDLAIGLKCSIKTAEAIKLSFGCAFSREVSTKDKADLAQFEEGQSNQVSRRYIAEIIEVRAREIFSLVSEELKSLGRAGKLPAGVVLCGGGAKLGGILDLVRDELKMPAQIGLPNLTEFESSHAQITNEIDDPEMAVACGLVLHKIDMFKKGGSFGSSLPGSLNESWYKRFLKSLIPSD